VRVLASETLPVIDRFAESGGIVVFVESLPDASVEEGADRKVAEWSHTLLDRFRDSVFLARTGGTSLIDVLRRVLDPDCLIADNSDVVSLRYRRGRREYYFLTNTSEERDYLALEAALAGSGKTYEPDPETGRVHQLASSAADGRVGVSLDLPRLGSRVVMLSSGRVKAEPRRPRLLPATHKLLAPPRSWQFEAEGGNYLPLADWEFVAGGYDTGREWLGYSTFYRARFRVADKPPWARLLLDGVLRQELYQRHRTKPVVVKLNDQEVGGFEPSTHYDRLCFEADVIDLLRKGQNELVIAGTGGMGEAVHLDQAQYLVGDFSLAWRGRRWVVGAPRRELKVGSWAEQGYPYFSGIGIYRASFRAPRRLPEGRLILRFAKVGDLVEVRLNGESVGVRAWPPYEVEVTGKVRPGRNDIELRIANTLHNLFRRDRRAAGLLGRVELLVAEA